MSDMVIVFFIWLETQGSNTLSSVCSRGHVEVIFTYLRRSRWSCV